MTNAVAETRAESMLLSAIPGDRPIIARAMQEGAAEIARLRLALTAAESRVRHLEDGMLEIINGIGCDRDQNIARAYLAQGETKVCPECDDEGCENCRPQPDRPGYYP